jgi:diguanylate cyclase (GGDEF)-like protein/PAS domain S-box-containing protein
MASRNSNLARFTFYLRLTLVFFAVFVATFIMYVRAEKEIDHANEVRLQSFRLASELWQSSDDLTRMARTYVITSAPIYRQHYQEILDIRDGKKPRPLDYQNTYWDMVMTDDRRPRPFGAAVPFLDLMRNAGFTNEEFALLAQSKKNSDSLTHTELSAIRLVDSATPSREAARAAAIYMLFDPAYQAAKAAIMRPISEFQKLVDNRTLVAVHAAESNATRMRLAFLAFGLLLLSLMWKARGNLYDILGCSINDLHSNIARLGKGDFAATIRVEPGRDDSILAWLAHTQEDLGRLDLQRKEAEERSRNLTRLYAALSHCNQAIVRCTGEAELFSEVCRIVVDFGGMKMAWIGEVDMAGNRVRPVAKFGSGTNYLEKMEISLGADDAHGRGPTGCSARDNVPIWCQDFLHDPATAPWHEYARQFGWAASASIPLHRNGVVRIFNVYADVIDAFDKEIRELLLEMATDIDYALKNFLREAQREHAETTLRAREQRLRTIIETEPECIQVVDATGRLVEINAAGLAMFEADSLETLQQHDFMRCILANYRAAFMDLLKRVLAGKTGILEFQIQGLGGRQCWLEMHAAPLHDSNGAVSTLLGIARDVTERKRAEERVQYLAHFDALTGLPNRAQLDDLAKYAIGLAQRAQEPLALLFLDLDNFKDINDTLGHSVGDALLVELSLRLRAALRGEDTVSRLGGDEFIFLLYGVEASGAAHVANKLLEVLDAPHRIEHYDLHVTGSIGIALYPADGADFEVLLRSADTAMYRAKQEGRHGYRFFTAEMQERSARQLQLVNALRQALERGQLAVHYQPQVSLRDGRIVGAEALLRWNHPELGSISPSEFIPVAEASGLIVPIGEWVLRQAVRQAKAWREIGLESLVIAVNLSAIQLRHSDLPKMVGQILDEEDLPPHCLELELTEGVALNDPQGAIAVMNDLHRRGVSISIDDFGTGYSSLSQLKKFKVGKIKIDQSFVRDITTDAEDRAIVRAIIHMAQRLGLKTVAEGVETEGQLAFLREQGCDEMQGYYYSRPLLPQPFEQFVRANSAAQPRPG